MCSGKEQLIRNLHRSSKGAPKRKEKMKKTIAILLVLVIGMVGVWAADAQLSLTTSVPVQTYIFVSNASFDSTGIDTFEEFFANVQEIGVTGTTGDADYITSGLTAVAVAGTPVELQSTIQTVGKLHYMTNAPVGVSVKMKASLLSSPTPATNAETIGYTVNVNGVTVVATSGATTESSAIGFAGSAGALTINNYDVKITLVETDYLNAPADTYNGDIYFNFMTT